MSSLSAAERYHIKKVLGVSGDFVLDFTGTMFGALFKQHSVNLHGDQYQIYRTSKARKYGVLGKSS